MIENWRPISLLNNDYKILALILSKRIKNVLNSIIDETQSGFLNNRHISNNIRLVLDIFDYLNLISDDSFLLFLDFYKAFDTLEHHFNFQCLEKFVFGIFFVVPLKHYIRTVVVWLFKKVEEPVVLNYGGAFGRAALFPLTYFFLQLRCSVLI